MLRFVVGYVVPDVSNDRKRVVFALVRLLDPAYEGTTIHSNTSETLNPMTQCSIPVYNQTRTAE
jgi:hypothetical protein